MADWHVSESENEEDGEPNGGRDPGLPVKATTLLNLIQTLEKERVLRLECASVLSGDRSHRKRRKKKRKRSNNEGGIGGDTTSEIASETDIKSAHTTTPSDCRDTRRPDLSVFDYEHEDFMSSSIPFKSHRPQKISTSLKKVAKLDDIEAGLKKDEEVRWKNVEDDFSPLVTNDQVPPILKVPGRVPVNGFATSNGSTPSKKGSIKFELGFEDSNEESFSYDLDSSFSTQDILTRIEHFLDDEI